MSNILELNGTHLGKTVTIEDAKGTGVTVSGTLHEVRHEADQISNPRYFGFLGEEVVPGRITTHVNIGGRSNLTVSQWATFTVEDATR
jgi:hypothetical protein